MGESAARGDGDSDPVAIGAELAAAAAADRSHRQTQGPADSPLEGVRYDFWHGDHDLARFVTSDADRSVAAVVMAFRNAGVATRTQRRTALSLDDFCTLLSFRPAVCRHSAATGRPR